MLKHYLVNTFLDKKKIWFASISDRNMSDEATCAVHVCKAELSLHAKSKPR